MNSQVSAGKENAINSTFCIICLCSITEWGEILSKGVFVLLIPTIPLHRLSIDLVAYF